MDVPDAYTPEPLALGDLLAAKGMPARGGGQIVEIKLGTESEQAVRDLRVQTGDEFGYGFDFSLIHIARDQQGAGQKERRNRSFRNPPG